MSKIIQVPSILGLYNFANSADEKLADSMQAILQSHNTSLKIERYLSTDSACATTGHLHIFDHSGMAVTLGTPEWKGKEIIPRNLSWNHAETLVEVYRHLGTGLLSRLSGCFAFILIDTDNQICMAAVDRLSRYPIFWAKTGSGIILSSSANMAHTHPDTVQSMNKQALFNYVYSHMIPSPGSIYTGIHKLLAGHALLVEGDEISTLSYWQPRSQPINNTSFSKATISLRKTLKRAIFKQLDDSVATGAFLSGGLDSSTVVGMLSEIAEKEVKAFSIGFAADGYDEMAYARITANHFGIKLHEYYVTPKDVVDALPIVAASFEEPFGNSSALPSYFCAKLAKDNGIDRLLAGDGGDELFAGNARYLKQKYFEAYTKLPKWLRRGVLEPAVQFLPNNLRIISKVNSYIRQANIPLPDRLQSYNFLHRHDKSELFTVDFLSGINADVPLEYQRGIYQSPDHASALARMLYLDWQYTLADNDLIKVSHMCALADIEVVYPMLDDELIEFACTIPDHWKIKHNKLRYFYKESLRGWLPDETISKTKQGFGLPFGVWMQTYKPLRDLAYDTLSSLKKRNIIRTDFINQLIKLHQGVHPAYYGELVWILTVLELWLAKHENQ